VEAVGYRLGLLRRIEIAHRRDEDRLRRIGKPFVPGVVADHGDSKKTPAIAEVEEKIAGEAARGPPSPAAQVEQKRGAASPPGQLGGESRNEPVVVAPAQPPARADPKVGWIFPLD